jgi:hypothetical protein
MTTFALVHDAFCSASTWELLIPELERRHHKAVAMDLPCDDPAAGCVRYAEAVVDALADHDECVIFLAAFIPRPGASFREQFAREEGKTTAAELPGGHMPMFSRPSELADALNEAVESSRIG